eukprot:PhF_6_TR3424/c0_g1_i2/m.4965
MYFAVLLVFVVLMKSHISEGKEIITLLPITTLKTHGSAGTEFFQTANGMKYLAAANFWDGMSQDMSAYSKLYRIIIDQQGEQPRFTDVQSFDSKGAHGVDFFSFFSPSTSGEGGGVDGGRMVELLVIPGYYYCGSERGSAKGKCRSTHVYQYNNLTNVFVKFQNLKTSGPAQTDHFFSGPHRNVPYLVVGENFNDEVCLYKWTLGTNGPRFKKHQCLGVYGAGSMKIAHIADKIHLIAGSYHDPSTGWSTKTKVFVSDNNENVHFTLKQEIQTHGCHDVEYIHIEGQHYLFLSEDRNGKTSKITSQVLRLNDKNGLWETIQRIPTDGAHAAEFFILPGQTSSHPSLYLFVANFGDRLGKRYKAKSTLWRATTTTGTEGATVIGAFEKVAEVDTVGATDVEFVAMGGSRQFLVVSNEGDLQKAVHSDSVVYEIIVSENGKLDEL